MIRQKRHFVVTVLEWGPDLGSRTFSDRSEKGGWRLPTLEEFEDAKKQKLKGFAKSGDQYWVNREQGDVGPIVPRTLVSSTWNSHTAKFRMRLVRELQVVAQNIPSNRKDLSLSIKL